MPGGLSKAYIGDKMIQLYCDGVSEIFSYSSFDIDNNSTLYY